MLVRNNYQECLTNLACSIRKYFGLEYKHNTLDYVDKILDERKPKNVVVILFDGMGSKILKRTLKDDDFFIKNMYKEITTVFPATTTAATTSIRTGLNPVEHGYLGWNTYIDKIDKTITLFKECEKGKEEVCQEFLDVKDVLIDKSIVDEINLEGKYKALQLYPFGDNKYNSLDEMFNIIESECKLVGKKYIYAYDDEPDHTMHDMGADSEEVKSLIFDRNKRVEKLANGLEDTIVFVVADHGHIKVDNIFLEDYPDIIEMLERVTSLEPRAVSFKIKNGLCKEFLDKFNKYFGEYFKIYDKRDIIDSKLFGDGEENPIFKNAIGDFIAIAENSNKALIYGDTPLYSHHAGYTDDEVYVPLIVAIK